MKRVATNITLLALLASFLLLLHSGRPGAPEAAPNEIASAHAAATKGAEPPSTAPAPALEPAGEDAGETAFASLPKDPASPPAGPPTEASTVSGATDTTDGPPPSGPADAAPVEPVAIDPGPGVTDAGMDAAVPDLDKLPVEEREEGEEAPDARSELAAETPESIEDPAAEPPAPHLDIADEPVEASVPIPETAPEDFGIAIDPLSAPGAGASEVPLAEAVAQAEERKAKPLQLLHGEVPPGTYQRLPWSATELFEGVPITTPVLVVNGRLPGPTLCLTAAVHGDELNGIEMVRRVMHDLEPKELSGAVIGVPIVNLQGFRRASRYLPDRRDLNRYFPGNPQGSQASRIAFSFFTEVVTQCDALIDLHTGSFERANLPQLRADLRNPDVVTLTQGFGATVILHSEPAEGTLRHAATRAGIPAVTLEAGGPTELELKEVMHGVKGIETLLNTLGMVREVRLWGDPEPVYYQSSWVRANSGGILLSDVSLGSTVERGDLLGTITDPMSNASTNLYSPYSGRIIGMARNQVVMPGFAAFHVGIQTAEATAAEREPSAEEDAALKHESEVGNQDYIDGMSE
jgi:hypothetical protein